MGDAFTRADLTVACMLAPLLGHPPDDLFQIEPGLRAMFGIATPEEPYFEPLRRWRDAMYRRHRGGPVTPAGS